MAAMNKSLAQMDKSLEVVGATNETSGANSARAPTMRQSGRAEF